MKIVNSLKDYLDSSLLQKPELIEDQFRKAAEFVLRNCLIRFNESEFQINEIEFYYYSEVHPDPYIHKHQNQLNMGSWYFHEVGQDITFGDGKNYGGILIRGIRDTRTSEDADGPVKTFDRLFNVSKLCVQDSHSFEIKESSRTLFDDDLQIYSFPRVGLQPTKDKQGEEFIIARYRYMFFPEITSRDRNVIYFYLKYIYKLKSIPEQITRDGATIKFYDELFKQGSNLDHEEYKKITDGEVKMTVTNKCKLLGYHFKDRINDN